MIARRVRIFKLDRTALATLVAVLALQACSSLPSSALPAPCVRANGVPAFSAPAVELNSGLTALAEGATDSITATAGPLPGVCTWSSSDPTVISIVGPGFGDGDSRVTVKGEGVGIATVSVTYSPRSGPPVADAMEIAVVRLDLDIAGVSEEDEETVGGFIALHAAASGLREITLAADSPPAGGQITLAATRAAGKVRLWRTVAKDVEVKLPATFGPPGAPGSLFVEGLEVTAGSREVELTLTLTAGPIVVEDRVRLSVVRVDLDVDSDRDGAVDDLEDEAGEDSWSADRGAMFMVNYDKDMGGRDGRPDGLDFDASGRPANEDLEINGPSDAKDITELVVRIQGIDEDDVRLAELRTPRLDQVRAVHLFEEIKPGQTVFWGGPGEVDRAVDIRSRVDIGGDTTLGVEGLFFRYTEPGAYGGTFVDGYDGLLDLELVVIAADGQLVGADRVRLKVAPFVVLPNTQDALEMWGRDSSLDDFRAGIHDTVVLQPYYTGGDQWTQDHIEIGYTQAPGRPRTHIVLRLPRARATTEGIRDDTPAWPQENLLGKDVGLFRFQNTQLVDGRNSGDFGGNIELAPPTADWPLGRIVVGDTIGDRLFRFFQDQQVQAPFKISTGWLAVGHVDEIMAFVPDGDRWAVVAADPELAKDLIALLEKDAVFFAEGRNSAGMGLTASDASSATRLVDQAGTDFRQSDWEYARYVRIYEGKGAGQVARISDRGSRFLEIDRVWRTPIKVANTGYEGPMASANSVGGLLDAISIPPRGEWFDVPDRTSRYLLVEDTRFWLDGVGNEVPSIISVSEVRDDDLLWELNRQAGASIRRAVDEVLARAGENVDVIPVPGIFMGSFDAVRLEVDSAFAFAPALANLQVVGGKVFFSLSYGPTDGDGNDVLQNGALREIPGVLQAIDGWDNYHRRIGNVHCFTYVMRAAYEFDWWASQSKG